MDIASNCDDSCERSRTNAQRRQRCQAGIVQLTLAVQHLANEIQLARREDAREREKMAMQLEIEFLKFEKRLPGAEGRPKTNEET